jgi:signal transduction histidine kinase
LNADRGAARTLPQRVSQLGVGELLAATIGLLLVLAVVGIGLALLANGDLTRSRNLLLNQVGPARRSSLALEAAYVNQETGVRGYVITANPSSLQPYRAGLREEASAFSEIKAREPAIGPMLAVELAAVRAKAEAWRSQYAKPALANPRVAAHRVAGTDLEGKLQFDALRVTLGHLRARLEIKDGQARNALQSAADKLKLLLELAAVLILGGVLGAGFLLRRAVTLPLARLGSEARRVAAGEFTMPLAPPGGSREIVEVGTEIDAMRQRIVDELAQVESARAQLEEQAIELQRSNADLEQFAYVASHDLQEPLRKIASFCQALQSRYGGQLDERADQYIDFAVDGAKRMQVLINDLLAFSRVGRSGREQEAVELEQVLETVKTALADALSRTGGSIVSGPLPAVQGDRAQLTSLLQNLISNALKFHGAEVPVIRLDARRDGDWWELSCSDNGLGIESEYAERIFLIFQRLHSRDAYEGTGIGLALCRKIVEYHGGRIWLDTEHADGASFHMTLPIIKESTP